MKVSSKIQPLVNSPLDNKIKQFTLILKKTPMYQPRFSEQSAGVKALIQTCGIIVDVCEMPTRESPPPMVYSTA